MRTGPKTSRRRNLGPVGHVGEQGRPVVQASQVVVRAAPEDRGRARLGGAPHEPVHPLEVLARDQWTQVGGVVARVALAERGGALEEPLDERVVERVLDEQPGPGQADLARVVELADGLLRPPRRRRRRRR